MHKVLNYGSVLQAYATLKVIQEMGYDCELIDYIYPNDYQFERGTPKRSLFSYLRILIRNYAWYRRRRKLKEFWSEEFSLSANYKNHAAIFEKPPVYDIYITGSDQVWNPRFMKGDAAFLLGFTPLGAKRIAFSSSFACKELDDSVKEIYKELLSRYAHISTREKGGSQLIEELLGKKVPVTLDPTLLLNAEEWKTLASKKKNNFANRQYILFYFLGYAFDPRPYIYDLLHYVQTETQLEIISFSVLPKDFNKVTIVADASPYDYLYLFENASYVITSSFHGTAFAANFGIPLYSVVKSKSSDDDRQSTLLNALGIDNCIVPVNTDFTLLNPGYDKEKEQKKLQEIRMGSLSCLKNMLES